MRKRNIAIITMAIMISISACGKTDNNVSDTSTVEVASSEDAVLEEDVTTETADKTTEKNEKADDKEDKADKTTESNKKSDKTTETITDNSSKKNENSNTSNSNTTSTDNSNSQNTTVQPATTQNNNNNNTTVQPTTTQNSNNNNNSSNNSNSNTSNSNNSNASNSNNSNNNSNSNNANTTTEAQRTTEATTEKQKVWHEPVYEDVWVVDDPGGDVPITEPHMVCNQCGYDLTSNGIDFPTHSKSTKNEDGSNNCWSYSTKSVEVGTKHYDEIGHWEKKLVQEGYWE